MKRLVLAATVALAVLGLYDAIRNLPVVSGCDFYAQCPAAAAEGDSPESEGALRNAR